MTMPYETLLKRNWVVAVLIILIIAVTLLLKSGGL
jgi:hypothetical protein